MGWRGVGRLNSVRGWLKACAAWTTPPSCHLPSWGNRAYCNKGLRVRSNRAYCNKFGSGARVKAKPA